MSSIVTYRGRAINREDISFICALIASHPEEGRCALSKRICREWNWVQPNGCLKDMICRGLLLRLEREGYIVLPPRKSTPPNPFLHRRPPEPVSVDETPIETSLDNLFPIKICQVRRSPSEKLFNGLIAQYHYLGYRQPVGEHLKYLILSNDRPLGCMALSSAAYHLACRDRFIGWSPDARKENIHLLSYNTRFLMLPWVKVPNLGSHLLGKFVKIIPQDWQEIYHHPVYWLETIVDTERFKGTCYRAANWIFLGKTTGRGLNDQTNRVNRSIKEVYGYPLIRDFRARLGAIK
jgi:hypothetical protein